MNVDVSLEDLLILQLIYNIPNFEKQDLSYMFV